MAVLQILTLPDERLKRESQLVENFDEALFKRVADLEETRLAGPAAVGIAAPQVGWFERVIILDCSTTRKPVPNNGHLILVNPEITEWSGYEVGREGCLSVPDFTGNVVRATHIKLVAQGLNGDRLSYEMEGYEARAAQHEIDHLDGTLFVDRVVSRRTDLFRRKVYKPAGSKPG